MHSVCLLSYNRPEFLHQCIFSMLEHAGEPIELLVHDDGSTNPNVKELLWKLYEDGLISTLILGAPGHNQGQGIALNRLFHAAQGDVIWKCDQDLIFQPNWLRDADEILEHDMAENGKRLGLLGGFHYWHDPCDSRSTMLADHGLWTSRTHILGSLFAVTRPCWEHLGPFEERWTSFGEDWEFQKTVTRSREWVCGLPTVDLVVNQGFGLGPSTVVIADEVTGQPVPSPINLDTYGVKLPS